MNARERFWNTMEYKPVDRSLYIRDYGWPETHQRWEKEGYDSKKEPLFQDDRIAWEAGWFFPNPPFERKVISEDDNKVLYINHEGILMRERKDNPFSSMPQFVRFPVETREDFRKFMKERMQPNMASRLGENWVQKLEKYKKRDYPLIVISDRWGGFFGPLRNLVGVKKLCMLFYDDPAFVEEMMDAIADHIIAIMDKILDHTDVDVFGFWEDMAYKTGPLIGSHLVRQYMLPRYRRVVDFLKSRSVKWISLDSDGQITSLIPVWLNAGINLLYPFEVQAGMDVNQVRREFGRNLRLMGGIDKRTLAAGPAEIDAELARIRPLIEEGGYLPRLDHSVPPDVSFSNYCYYMNRLYDTVCLK
ncbi:MAG: uroporphyrinogen decarboxylase family protein [Clostridia bacterium]|jgi:uroporphyrinogen-III decarboxylase